MYPSFKLFIVIICVWLLAASCNNPEINGQYPGGVGAPRVDRPTFTFPTITDAGSVVDSTVATPLTGNVCGTICTMTDLRFWDTCSALSGLDGFKVTHVESALFAFTNTNGQYCIDAPVDDSTPTQRIQVDDNNIATITPFQYTAAPLAGSLLTHVVDSSHWSTLSFQQLIDDEANHAHVAIRVTMAGNPLTGVIAAPIASQGNATLYDNNGALNWRRDAEVHAQTGLPGTADAGVIILTDLDINVSPLTITLNINASTTYELVVDLVPNRITLFEVAL